MGDEREPVNYERPIRQSGSCFVWKWRSKKNQNIIIFPKRCLFKTETLGKITNIQFLDKLCRRRPQTNTISKHPQTIGTQLGAPGRIWRSKALDLERQTRHHSESFSGCSSHRPQSVEFSMTEKYKSPIF